MYDVTAHAIRYQSTLEVTIAGFLPSSCYEATIKDIYPGGNIVYIRDPEAAQVFIEETTKPNVQLCTLQLVPWIRTVVIPDAYHKDVEIIINNARVLKVAIAAKESQFIVIQLTGGFVPNGGYSIVPDGTRYSRIYTKKFGPASYQECEKWIEENTDKRFPILDSFAMGFGGGSEAPRGFFGDDKTQPNTNANDFPRSNLLSGHGVGNG